MRHKISATAAFRALLQVPMDMEEPSMRNSNFLPVKAKGEVRFRSDVSRGNQGMALTPISMLPPWRSWEGRPVSISSRISVRSSPKNTEMMGGGASWPPSRWSLPGLVTEARSSSACQSILRGP